MSRLKSVKRAQVPSRIFCKLRRPRGLRARAAHTAGREPAAGRPAAGGRHHAARCCGHRKRPARAQRLGRHHSPCQPVADVSEQQHHVRQWAPLSRNHAALASQQQLRHSGDGTGALFAEPLLHRVPAACTLLADGAMSCMTAVACRTGDISSRFGAVRVSAAHRASNRPRQSS